MPTKKETKETKVAKATKEPKTPKTPKAKVEKPDPNIPRGYLIRVGFPAEQMELPEGTTTGQVKEKYNIPSNFQIYLNGQKVDDKTVIVGAFNLSFAPKDKNA